MDEETFVSALHEVSKIRNIENSEARKQALTDYINFGLPIFQSKVNKRKNPLHTVEALLLHASMEHGGEMIDHLQGRTTNPLTWGAAALHSKNDWQRIPDDLREDRKFQRKALKAWSGNYFYLDEAAREELAWDFVKAASEESADPHLFLDIAKFPVALATDEKFALRASKVYEFFPFLIPEPLRSNMKFARKLQKICWYLPLGLFSTPQTYNEVEAWGAKELQIAIDTKLEQQALLKATPTSESSTKKKFKV